MPNPFLQMWSPNFTPPTGSPAGPMQPPMMGGQYSPAFTGPGMGASGAMGALGQIVNPTRPRLAPTSIAPLTPKLAGSPTTREPGQQIAPEMTMQDYQSMMMSGQRPNGAMSILQQMAMNPQFKDVSIAGPMRL